MRWGLTGSDQDVGSRDEGALAATLVRRVTLIAEREPDAVAKSELAHTGRA